MHKRQKGNIGEDVACKYISSRGFYVLDRNYQRKWGELDIVAEKDKALHFFEVKSVTKQMGGSVQSHVPEENVHRLKLSHIRRMVETYLFDKYKGMDKKFHFHVLCVYLNMENRTGRVKWIKDIIL